MRLIPSSRLSLLVLMATVLVRPDGVTGHENVIPTGEYDITVFLSEVGTVGNGVELENPIQEHTGVGGSGTLYVWIDSGDVGLDGVSLRVRTSVPGVISIQEPPTVFNPDIVDASDNNADTGWDRWDVTGYTDWFYDREPDVTDSFLGVSAFYDTVGIEPEFDGSTAAGGWRDPLYDTSAGAFLFAQIDYDVVGLGSTPLYLEVGERGIISDIGGHTSEVDVFFGDGEFLPSNALNAWSQRLIPSVLPDAIINVFPGLPGAGSGSVPEPSGWTLVALGLITLLTKRRRTWHTLIQPKCGTPWSLQEDCCPPGTIKDRAKLAMKGKNPTGLPRGSFGSLLQKTKRQNESVPHFPAAAGGGDRGGIE